MPIYEYECQNCRRHVEVMQRISDPPLGECSDCGGELKKLISAPAFQFKGSGWYVTDYARKGDGGKKEGGAESKESGSGGSASSETSSGDSASSSKTKTESSGGAGKD